MSTIQCSVTSPGEVYLLDSSGRRLPGDPTVTIGIGSIIQADQNSLTPPVSSGPTSILAPQHLFIVMNTDPSGGTGQWGEVKIEIELHA